MKGIKNNNLTYKCKKIYNFIKKKILLIPINLKSKLAKVCVAIVLSLLMLVSVAFPYVSANSGDESKNSHSREELLNKENNAKVMQLCAKADACVDKADNQKAIEYLTEAIKLKPKDVKLYDSRAALFAKVEKYGMAIEDYQSVMKYEPEKHDVYLKLANMFYNKKDYDKACIYYTKALDYESGEKVLIPLATAYMQLEKYEESVKYLNKSIKLNNLNKKEAIYSRAVAYMLDKKYEDAIKDLNESILLKYNINECNLYLGKCYYGMEIYNKAISYFEKYFKNCPNDCKDMSLLAICYYNCSKSSDAKEWFKKCLDNNIDKEVSNYYLGTIYLKEKNYSDAITYFDSCLETKYRQEYCLYNRAVAYLYKNNVSKAKADFEDVLKISKDKELNSMAQKALDSL